MNEEYYVFYNRKDKEAEGILLTFKEGGEANRIYSLICSSVQKQERVTEDIFYIEIGTHDDEKCTAEIFGSYMRKEVAK